MEITASNLKYPYLPNGRVILYVPIDSIYMSAAKEIALTSYDRAMPTGAVAVIEGDIIAKASNKPPLRNNFLVNLHKKYCIRRIFGIPSGQKYWLCPGCAGSENHAESRVSTELKKKGNTKPFDLYLWGHWWCCEPCWNAMISAGVKDVYLLDRSEILFNNLNKDNIIGRQFQ
ncbi:MAG: hypothetical protein AAB477_02340 [Patescibacteria group bacterium]